MRISIHGAMGVGLLALALGLCSTANADTLYSRLGGLAYYDATTNLTWLANADAGYGSSYDAADGVVDGYMTWANANAWTANLNIDGVSGWRLPDTNPINGTAYNYNVAYDGSTDRGYNMSAPGTVHAGSKGSELAYMYYNTLGNMGYVDTVGNYPQPGWGLSNTGPFSNIQSTYYWSATSYGLDTRYAWDFDMGNGNQAHTPKTTAINGTQYIGAAWAVHAGDVSAVPLPAAVWLFSSGLLGLMGVGAKRPRRQ